MAPAIGVLGVVNGSYRHPGRSFRGRVGRTVIAPGAAAARGHSPRPDRAPCARTSPSTCPGRAAAARTTPRDPDRHLEPVAIAGDQAETIGAAAGRVGGIIRDRSVHRVKNPTSRTIAVD